MIWLWLKRILPVVIIAAILLGYKIYTKNRADRMEKDADLYALVTAKVWVASAWFRNEPDKFISFRDSILKESAVSSEEMKQYFEIYRSKSEKYEHFTEKVKEFVDSLSLINEMPFTKDSILDIDSVISEAGG